MRKTLWLLLVPAVLLIGGYFYLHNTLWAAIKKEEGGKPALQDTLGGKQTSTADLRPLLIKRVQQLVEKSSNRLYQVTIANLDIDVLASSLALQGVRLTPNAAILDSLKALHQLPDDVVSISFDSLRIDGINLDDALTSKTMDYRQITLLKPVISIHHQKGAVKKDETEAEPFSKRFLKEMERLAIKNLAVADGTVRLYNDVKKGPPTVLKHLSVQLQNVLLDSATRTNSKNFLFAEKATISFRDFNQPTPDGLYNFKIGSATITAPENNVRLTGVSFTSPFSRAQFSSRQKKSKELYRLTLPAVTVTDVNWGALLNQEELVAREIKTTGGAVSVYLDRTLPPRNRMGNFPSQVLMKLPMPL
ncbi:MAG TPA: hypothetical protein VM010_00550, partial [Chitinophagaceae bacterium]|nr:hypothetical protein [Chitinophagaceae bacterium]